MAKCGAVPFAVLTLGFFYSSFLSLRALANKVVDTAALEFSLSIVLHLIVGAGFIYLTWRTYRRPTIADKHAEPKLKIHDRIMLKLKRLSPVQYRTQPLLTS